MAAEAAAQAAINEARATLSTNETNLSKASIRSPINGVVLSRSVDPGNAVAASLQAVTLFAVAEDLTQLKLDVAVDEADVGNVKVEQAWGSAQIMGAIQDNYGAVEGKLGYAVGAGVTVNLPMLAAGDTLSLQAAYAKGLTRYTISDIQDYTAAADFVVVGTSVEQAASWSVGAGLTHNWTKTLSSSIGASYASFDAYLSANDFKQVDVQGNLVWSPVKGLAIGAELEYRRVDVDAAAGRPDVDALVGLLRVQRTF